MSNQHEQIIDDFRALDIRAKITTAGTGERLLKLSRGSSQAKFTLRVGPDARLAGLYGHQSDPPIFVYAPSISSRSAAVLRGAGVRYLDASGNAWIEFGEVLISIRGETGTQPRKQIGRSPQAADLFSSGRSQVIAALLAWPDLWRRPQRELAAASGVSLGQAHKTLGLLEQGGWADGRGRRMGVSLLDLWATAFPSGLGRRLYLASYTGDIDWQRPSNEADPPAVSGESAVPDLLRPGTLTLYVRELDLSLSLRHRWRADGEPNIFLRRKFWHAPAWAASVDEPTLAPWPVVFADLLSSDDPRVRDAAAEVRVRHE